MVLRPPVQQVACAGSLPAGTWLMAALSPWAPAVVVAKKAALSELSHCDGVGGGTWAAVVGHLLGGGEESESQVGPTSVLVTVTQ